MPIKKTNEQWIAEVEQLVGKKYTFKEPYINQNTKIAVEHNECGTNYTVTPKAFLVGNRCPHCNPYKKKTTNKFKEEVYKLVGDEYTVISEYNGRHKPVYVKHIECGTTYPVTPGDFLKGRRCKQCYFKAKLKTNNEWLKQVKLLTGDDYTFLEEYKGDNIKIAYKHSCGGTHQVSPNNFINGTRCPICKESIGESYIRRYLDERDIPYEAQKTFEGLMSKKPLSYDFYLPERDTLIEYQGVQHYKPIVFFGGQEQFERQEAHDKLKRAYANNKGYLLIEIPYTCNTYKEIKSNLDNTMSKLPNAT